MLDCTVIDGKRAEMKDKLDISSLNQLVANVIRKKHIYNAVFYVSSGDNSMDVISTSGNMQEDSPYYIASINKFIISSIILRLVTNKKLDLHDKISKYLPEETVQGLHLYRSKDYSQDITITHLISHTSGLPCYLIDKQANGKKAMAELESGMDQPWPIDKVIEEVKRMKTHFPPGKEGMAKYVDTNHHILGFIIEIIAGKPIHSVLNRLFEELNMSKTYVFENQNEENFVPIRYKSKIIHVPLFLSSTKYDIISTAKDQMTFLKRFFDGYFYPKERLHELERWNNIFFPFKYGLGIQKFAIPRLFSPFQPVAEMIGHSGSTGAVAFYVPDLDVYITGTINQQARPNISFQTMIKITQKVRK